MDNNNERTDQFFRERLSVYEEMPADQVWDKIASRLEVEKRKKLIYLFLRIAAGMTLLFSLGLGYHLIYKTGHQKALLRKNPRMHLQTLEKPQMHLIINLLLLLINPWKMNVNFCRLIIIIPICGMKIIPISIATPALI
jgi:hypothetical protein